MIICSWNINSIRVRENQLLKLIEVIKPDVIFLQEIKCDNKEFPKTFIKHNYNSIVNGEKGKYGVAILIKNKIKYKTISFDSDTLNRQARIVGIRLMENFKLNLINIYSPNGNPMEDNGKFKFKLEWLDELKKVIKEQIEKNENLILGGDFNVLDEFKDVIDFENWENDALGNILSRKKFREILFSGLTNIVRLFYKPGEQFSFWDYQKASWERNYGLLIDHFLVTPKMSSLVERISFEKEFRSEEKPSDHIPIWIKLSI